MKMEKYFVILLLISAVAVFFGGYEVASQKYEHEFALAKNEYLAKVRNLESKYRAKERENAEALIEAWDERDRARVAIKHRDTYFTRMRLELDRAKRRLSEATSDTCKSERERLSEASAIIERGADLVRRYDELASKSVTDKDVVVRIHESK